MHEQLKKCESGFTFEFCCTLPPANSLTELTIPLFSFTCTMSLMSISCRKGRHYHTGYIFNALQVTQEMHGVDADISNQAQAMYIVAT